MDRTKLWIAEHMKQLMAAKPIEKIRVTELCRAAGITPPTFYYHFRDKYDLVAWIFYSDAFETDVLGLEEAAAGLRKMKREYLFYKRAYEDSSQNALWSYMLDYFTDRYLALARERLGTDVLDEELRFSIRHYCYGSVGTTREWLLNDNTTSAQTVVQMMFESMPENMREIFFTQE